MTLHYYYSFVCRFQKCVNGSCAFKDKKVTRFLIFKNWIFFILGFKKVLWKKVLWPMDFSKILWNDSRPGQLSIATYTMYRARSRTFELVLGNCGWFSNEKKVLFLIIQLNRKVWCYSIKCFCVVIIWYTHYKIADQASSESSIRSSCRAFLLKRGFLKSAHNNKKREKIPLFHTHTHTRAHAQKNSTQSDVHIFFLSQRKISDLVRLVQHNYH